MGRLPDGPQPYFSYLHACRQGLLARRRDGDTDAENALDIARLEPEGKGRLTRVVVALGIESVVR